MKKINKQLQDVLDLIGEDDPMAALRVLTEEEVRRLEGEKYKFYEPNGKCEEFIHAVGCGDYFVVMFSAANGVGKSAAGANVLANIVYENENEYFQDKLFKEWPYPKRGRIVTDTGNVEGVVNTIKEWLPEGRYKTKKAGKAHESKWSSDTGFNWEIMTYNQDDKDFEGPTLGFVWFDEPPTKSKYKACVSRLRKGGIIFITATPLEGSGWLYDHIVGGKAEDGELEELAKGQRINIEAGVEAACKQHGVRGHLEHDHIQAMIAEYDEDEQQARVHGKFQHLAGLRFKRWNRSVHVIKSFQINPREYCVYQYIDPHPRNPDAVLWVAVNKYNQKFVVDELFIKCLNGTEELAGMIKKRDDMYRIIWRAGDPSMFIKDQHQDESTAMKFARYGLSYVEATKQRTASDKAIEDALAYVQLPTGEFAKEPDIFIMDNCKWMIWEMEHYRWDEWSGKTGDKKDKKEKTVDKDDHMVENLGRALFAELVFVPMPVRSSGSSKVEFDCYD